MLDELLALTSDAPPRPRPRLVVAPPVVETEEAIEEAIEEAPAAPVPGQALLFDDLPAPTSLGSLQERFGVPPFSTLDARAGYWQSRKAEWLALGIQSEVGRGDELVFEGGINDMNMMSRRRAAAKAEAEAQALAAATGNRRRDADRRSNLNGAQPVPEWAQTGMANMAPGTSIFDPVLCEIAYRWFTPGPGSAILDPFAGGSVRGIVAAVLGHDYVGVDLSERQIAANREQAASIVPNRRPTWIRGDAREIEELLPPGEHFDLILSCPPYYDLEVYSDDPSDLSAAPSYDAFLEGYEAAIRAALGRLRDDRFAVWVIGEIRDKRGMQRGLVADTVRIFRDAGAPLYNEAVLLQQPGTLPMRVRRQMDVGRKLGRGHQAVLVFWKGSASPRWSPISTASEGPSE